MPIPIFPLLFAAFLLFFAAVLLWAFTRKAKPAPAETLHEHCSECPESE